MLQSVGMRQGCPPAKNSRTSRIERAPDATRRSITVTAAPKALLDTSTDLSSSRSGAWSSITCRCSPIPSLSHTATMRRLVPCVCRPPPGKTADSCGGTLLPARRSPRIPVDGPAHRCPLGRQVAADRSGLDQVNDGEHPPAALVAALDCGAMLFHVFHVSNRLEPPAWTLNHRPYLPPGNSPCRPAGVCPARTAMAGSGPV